MKNSQIVLFVGSLSILLALFLPAISVQTQNQVMGVSGSASYFESDEVFGVILLILSVGTMILVFLKKTEIVWITGLISIGIFIFRFFKFVSDISSYNSFQNQMGNFGQFGNEFPQMPQEVAIQISLNWASWTVFLIGGVLTIAGLVKSTRESK
ncbi:MAG: hypothetical protein FXF54_00725 [Kosmotoga sp.]|nr:MAG: hypothetical protein FXF54_00725 [Kosmotoga sp.]